MEVVLDRNILRMKYEREIGEWTKKYAICIVKLCAEMRKARLDLDVIIQLRKCGTSVGANVNEGKASSSRKELIRFYQISLRSCYETIFWIDVIKEGYGYRTEQIEKCLEEAKEIKKALTAIINKLR